VNLGLLGYFKYRIFLVDAVSAALGTDWHLPPVVLPLAISFFTFEQITYLVETYHGETGEYDGLGYGPFISFFPHLIAGPIVRFRQLVPQFGAPDTWVFSPGNVASGLLIFAIGLFKKVMVADTFSGWVGPIFDRAPTVVFSDAWGATLAYALQLYFDFSGYSDMAIGLALMLNIVLPENFDSPYQAHSIIDFWRTSPWAAIGRDPRDGT
jgi:D-alanyl-lipoteichoic acid acyltransferase DltB (MBOAT superfamily)